MSHISRIYLSQISLLDTKIGDIIEIAVKTHYKQYHHLVNVMRIKANDTITIFNGSDDISIDLKAQEITKKSIISKIILIKKNPIAKNIKKYHLILPILKKDQLEEALRMCTEIGIDEFILINTIYSQNISKLNFERMNDIIISAAMQCNINVLPKINEKIYNINNLPQIIKNGDVFFANEELSNIQSKSIYNNIINQNSNNVYCIVGPEGGFASEEIDFINSIKDNNINIFQINLGKNILRASTAALTISYHAINFKM